MAFSIRTKLTFWYVSLLTISLLAFGGAFSYTLTGIFVSRVDEQIGSLAGMMAHTVIKPSGQLLLPGDFDIILERFFGIRIAGNYVQVLDPSGRVVARSSNLEKAGLPVSDDVFQRALKGRVTFENTRNFAKYPVRVVTRPIIFKDNRLVAIVQVGASLEGMEEIFHSLFIVFITGFFVSVAIAGAVGWFLARKALRPVAELTAMARRIGVDNLGERINVAVKEDEIGRLAATVNDMIARLEKSFLQTKQFTADASHELKTPLTILKGEMEVALRADSSQSVLRETIASSLEEIDRMSYIVRNLLDLARMDVEKESAPKTAVRVDGVITERFEHFKKSAIDGGLRLSLSANAPLTVYGDPVRLGQLVFNLLDNALKYTPRGGLIELSSEKDSDFAVIKVKDTGIGISQDDLPYIFDRFFRVDKVRGRDDGTSGAVSAGLGLSICSEIIRSLNGTITAESEYGKGTVFTVRLPLESSEGSDKRVN